MRKLVGLKNSVSGPQVALYVDYTVLQNLWPFVPDRSCFGLNIYTNYILQFSNK